jgi:hypothetical protein
MNSVGRAALLGLVGPVAVAALAATALYHGDGNAALAQGPITLAIDMDPYGSPANSCPGDGVHDCTVGSIEYCLPVPATEGTTFDVDGVVTGLWNGSTGWGWDLFFPDTATGAKLTMTKQVETDPLINLMPQSPGSGPIISLTDAVPDPPGPFSSPGSPHMAAVVDFGTAETTPPWTQGVTSRMTFQVGAGAMAGVYGLSFNPDTYGVVGEDLITHMPEKYAEVTVLDYNSSPQYGVLALGVPCPPPSTPTPTPTPTPSPTPPPPPPNDDFADAVRIAELPFTDTVVTTAAGSELGEPHPCSVPTENTVWYSFTPTRNTYLQANVLRSDWPAVLAIYRGDSLGSLKHISCSDADPESMLGVVAKARTTYYFQASAGQGRLVFNLTLAHDAMLSRLRLGGESVRNGQTKTVSVVVRNLGDIGDEFDVSLYAYSESSCQAAIDDPHTVQREQQNQITRRISVPAHDRRTLRFNVTYTCASLTTPPPQFHVDAAAMDIHDLDPNLGNNTAIGTQYVVPSGAWWWLRG